MKDGGRFRLGIVRRSFAAAVRGTRPFAKCAKERGTHGVEDGSEIEVWAIRLRLSPHFPASRPWDSWLPARYVTPYRVLMAPGTFPSRALRRRSPTCKQKRGNGLNPAPVGRFGPSFEERGFG